MFAMPAVLVYLIHQVHYRFRWKGSQFAIEARR
jgi:hypothetical protein